MSCEKSLEPLSCCKTWIATAEALADAAIPFFRTNSTGNGCSGALKLHAVIASFYATRLDFQRLNVKLEA